MAKEQYHELAEYVIEYYKAMETKLGIPVDVKSTYLADDKQKTLVKISKINDKYSSLLKADILVSFNENLFDAFDDEILNILIDQELALVEFDYEKGTVKIGKADLITSYGIIARYGVEAVERANKCGDLYNKQQAEKEKEERNK